MTKPAKEFTDAMGRRKVKGNMDIELAIDVMQLADKLDHIVLFSGDGDFRSLVAAVQAKGRRVTVVSTLTTRPPMIADDLRRQTDQFIDLADLRDEIGRDPAEREVRQRERAPAPAAAKESFEDFAISEPVTTCPTRPRLPALPAARGLPARAARRCIPTGSMRRCRPSAMPMRGC